mmetsp:Transcript_21120/g.66764  ORF Transcript_21120/g.66764 Transcript_21120/m.66764 type:complete len:486 (-) Transcript_21120:2-1459(-)
MPFDVHRRLRLLGSVSDEALRVTSSPHRHEVPLGQARDQRARLGLYRCGCGLHADDGHQRASLLAAPAPADPSDGPLSRGGCEVPPALPGVVHESLQADKALSNAIPAVHKTPAQKQHPGLPVLQALRRRQREQRGAVPAGEVGPGWALQPRPAAAGVLARPGVGADLRVRAHAPGQQQALGPARNRVKRGRLALAPGRLLAHAHPRLATVVRGPDVSQNAAGPAAASDVQEPAGAVPGSRSHAAAEVPPRPPLPEHAAALPVGRPLVVWRDQGPGRPHRPPVPVELLLEAEVWHRQPPDVVPACGVKCGGAPHQQQGAAFSKAPRSHDDSAVPLAREKVTLRHKLHAGLAGPQKFPQAEGSVGRRAPPGPGLVVNPLRSFGTGIGLALAAASRHQELAVAQLEAHPPPPRARPVQQAVVQALTDKLELLDNSTGREPFSELRGADCLGLSHKDSALVPASNNLPQGHGRRLAGATTGNTQYAWA